MAFAGSWLALIIIKKVSSYFMLRLIFKFFCLLFEWATRIPHHDCSKHKLNLGGGSSKVYTFSQTSEHLVVVAGTVSDVSQLEEAVFRYVAHVNEVDLFAYPYPQLFAQVYLLMNCFLFFQCCMQGKLHLFMEHLWDHAALHLS